MSRQFLLRSEKGGTNIYKATITVFNYYESSTAQIWYPHTLKNVDLVTDRGALIKKYGVDSADNAELHIAYTEMGMQKIITNATGKEIIWLPPKAWAKQVNDELADSITFSPSTDFFWNGEWTGVNPVNDEDYRDGFYAYMNNRYDFVYLVSSVGGPYSVIPHFEILGK
uniref:hypothetical protein n=1 Tax=Enterocloster aldenensis TaxID=358742 RepID=UPI0015D51338